MTAKDLKNALLQEAVQGKLVPQIASEGNARDLLEQIRKERGENLPLAPKPSRSTNRSCKQDDSLRFVGLSATPSAGSNAARNARFEPISKDEIPFEIPENWCWCRLGEIVFNNGQKTPDKEFSYIDIGSIDNKLQKLNENENLIQADKAPSRARKIVKKGDIIYSTVRPYLHNMCIIDKDFLKEPIASTGFAVMSCPSQVLNKYLFYYLLSPSFDNYANDTENAKGVAYPAINDDRLYKGIVPLPPLAEQKRIVSAIEKFMPLIEEYGKKEAELKALNANIGALTKKAILQEAIQGRLVPALNTSFGLPGKDPSCPQADTAKTRGIALQTGTELLEQIRAEKKKLIKEGKLKKEKPLPEITEDEIPFEIPKNWCWCRLGEICTKLVDGDHNPPAGLSKKTEYLMLSSRNINDNKLVDLEAVRYLSKEVFEKENERTNAEKGDIFFTSVGTIGRSCIFDGSLNISFQRSVSVLRTMIFNYYLKYCLDSSYVQNYVIANATGTAQKGFYLNQLAELLVPFPPLAEQKRIVAAIEQLLPLCEKLGENENAK